MCLCREEEVVQERAVDGAGNQYLTIKELQAQEAQRRAGGSPPALPCLPYLRLGFAVRIVPLQLLLLMLH